MNCDTMLFMEQDKAKIIAFCGIDGSGKSTQLKLTKDYLSKDAKVMVAKLEYSPLNKMGDNKFFDLALKGYSGLKIISYYYNLQHKDAFEYDYILCDRHLLCYLSYAYAYNIPHLNIVRDLLFMVDDPDMTFYFDVPVEVALDRISKRSFRDRNENIDTLTKAKEGYEYTMGLFDNVYRIDNTLSEEESFELVKDKIRCLRK